MDSVLLLLTLLHSGGSHLEEDLKLETFHACGSSKIAESIFT